MLCPAVIEAIVDFLAFIPVLVFVLCAVIKFLLSYVKPGVAQRVELRTERYRQESLYKHTQLETGLALVTLHRVSQLRRSYPSCCVSFEPLNI